MLKIFIAIVLVAHGFGNSMGVLAAILPSVNTMPVYSVIAVIGAIAG